MHYDFLDHKSHAFESLLVRPVLPHRVIVDFVDAINQGDLLEDARDRQRTLNLVLLIKNKMFLPNN